VPSLLLLESAGRLGRDGRDVVRIHHVDPEEAINDTVHQPRGIDLETKGAKALQDLLRVSRDRQRLLELRTFVSSTNRYLCLKQVTPVELFRESAEVGPVGGGQVSVQRGAGGTLILDILGRGAGYRAEAEGNA
jgi:hypothetical protein